VVAQRGHLDLAAAAVSTRLTAHRLATTNDPAKQAELYTAHATRLANAGLHEQTAAAAYKATEIYRGLDRTNSKVHLRDLAGSLTNLSKALSDLGRIPEALDASGEATMTWQWLVRAAGTSHLPGLGAAFTNFSANLALSGRQREAQAPAEEAVKIYRWLAQEDPNVYLVTPFARAVVLRDLIM
jgi:hypothetical protein